MSKITNKWLEKLWSNKEKTSFENIRKVLSILDFKKTFKIFNVVGTNGKGSVTFYIAQGLSDKYKVGTFTSPHIKCIKERIQVLGICITDDFLKDTIDENEELFKEYKISWFAILYICSLLYFQKQKVDYAILEAGIGGEFDPTNSIDGEYGVVTSIGIDHIEHFGTIKNIAESKSKIINKGMVFFIPSTLIEKDVFSSKADEYLIINNEANNYIERNKLLSKGIVENITKVESKELSTPFGRTTIIHIKGREHIYDVAHNYDGILESLKYIKHRGVEFENVVLSFSANKDISKINELFNDVNIFLYEHNGPKPLKIENYNVKGREIKDLKNFVSLINGNTLFIGSFFLISELVKDD